MRKFTNYIAMKYAQGGLPEIEDIDLKALEITSEELQNRLDVSISTANNWCAKRNPISKMGKLAIKYAIQREITKISQKLQRKYSLFLDNGQYKIISSPTKDQFKVLAQTDDPKIARTVEYINVIYEFMQSYYEYLTHHIGEGDNKTELINLLDMIFYLETGDFYSQKSDYCLDDKNKPNDVMTFTIYPFIHPYMLKDGIKQYLSKDIKDFKNLSEKAISYIKDAPYFFSIVFVIQDKNNIFNLEQNKQLIEKTIKGMENWPQNKKEEFIHKMKSFREYLNRKKVAYKTLSNISVTVHIMSAIIEFLLIKASAKHIYWISDRDEITNFQDGIVHEFIRLGYANLLNRRVPDDKVYGFLEAKDYEQEIFDEFVRVPDYICGAVASMNFDNVDEVPDKHYDLFDKSIVDNKRIYIMRIKHEQNEDALSDLKFTRSINAY